MIKIRGTVTYEGGSVVEWEAGPPAFVEWELYALRHKFPPKLSEAPELLALMVIAHAALGIAEGFDVWRKSLVDFASEAVEEVPPTPPVPSLAR